MHHVPFEPRAPCVVKGDNKLGSSSKTADRMATDLEVRATCLIDLSFQCAVIAVATKRRLSQILHKLPPIADLNHGDKFPREASSFEQLGYIKHRGKARFVN